MPIWNYLLSNEDGRIKRKRYLGEEMKFLVDKMEWTAPETKGILINCQESKMRMASSNLKTDSIAAMFLRIPASLKSFCKAENQLKCPFNLQSRERYCTLNSSGNGTEGKNFWHLVTHTKIIRIIKLIKSLMLWHIYIKYLKLILGNKGINHS